MGPLIVVKIVFVIDCTGSMDPWIHEAKTKIQDIIEVSSEQHANAQFEVALVSYRDYGDTVRFRVADFCSANQVVQALDHVRAEGGDDAAEDVAGALDHVSRLTWGPSNVRMMFHIADAPAHGLAYHAIQVSDRFPEGDPEGKNIDEILRYLVELNVEYTFVRITSSTDMMLDVFHKIIGASGGRFRVIDLNPQSYDGRYGTRRRNMAQLLSPAVSRAVSQAVTQYSASQDM